MARFAIPSSRVFLFDENVDLVGGSTAMPARPRLAGGETAKEPIVGGSKVLDMNNGSGKLFVVVNAAGIPVLTGLPPKQKTYEAASPSSAAVKAFYAWWRSTSQGSVANSCRVAQRQVPAELQARIRAFDLKRDQQDAFLQAWLCVDAKQLQKRLLVRLAPAGGLGSVKNYVVSYVLNEKPNKLEVQKRIVVTAKATPLSFQAPRPADVLDLESML